MKKSKFFLVISAVFGTLIFGAVLVLLASSNATKTQPQNSTQTSLLGQETQTVEEKPLPTLEVFTQPVFVSASGNNYQKAVGGETINVGTKVKTDRGGRAQIVYPNKSVTRIDQNTIISVDKLDANDNFTLSLKIEAGRVWSRVAKLLGAESYETKTTNTVAAIRGTSYGHGTDPAGEDIIISFRNNVLGKCINKSQQAQVLQNSKATFGCKAGQQAVIQTLTPNDMADFWLNFNKAQDEKLDKKNGTTTYGDKPVVLGASASPSPAAATPTPTPLPETPSPSPSPSGNSLSIGSIEASFCFDGECAIKILGSGFVSVYSINAKDVSGRDTKNYLGVITNTTQTEMDVLFEGIPTGTYTVTVKLNDGQSATSEFGVKQQ